MEKSVYQARWLLGPIFVVGFGLMIVGPLVG
jgi:hypothetical protein